MLFGVEEEHLVTKQQSPVTPGATSGQGLIRRRVFEPAHQLGRRAQRFGRSKRVHLPLEREMCAANGPRARAQDAAAQIFMVICFGARPGQHCQAHVASKGQHPRFNISR